MDKIFIWTHADMDGAGCVLALSWLFCGKYDIEYKGTTAKKFKDDYEKWKLSNDISKYKKIFICDLDITDSKDIVDTPQHFIIDHHESHNPSIYSNCKCLIRTHLSACDLILTDLLKNKISDKRKVLLKLITDYDSFTLKYKQSRLLNIIFWSLTGDRILKFVEMYKDGFYPFDKFQQNTISIYENKLSDYIRNCSIYETIWNINNKQYKIGACIATSMIDDIAVFMLNQKYDIIIIVNTNIMSVSFRKQTNCPINLSKIGQKFGGGGHEYAAGCPLTDEFQELLKKFKKVR